MAMVEMPAQFCSPDLHDIHPDISNCTNYFWALLHQRTALLNANVVIEIVGMPGVSKSWSGLTITDWVNSWGYGHKLKPDDVEAQISFSNDDCANQMQSALDGQCFLDDERPRPSGLGADTAQEALENILDIVRKRRISVVLISPTPRELPFYTFQLTSLSVMYTNRLGIFKCMAGNKVYGLVQIPAPRSELIPPYERAKDVFTEKMMRHGGTSGVNLKRIVNQLWAHPKIQACRFKKKGILKATIAIDIPNLTLPTNVLPIVTDYIHDRFEMEELEAQLAEGDSPKRKRRKKKTR